MKYSVDTSAILHAWRRSYPPENFPGFWQRVDELINRGEFVASEEVFVELERKDDDVHQWVRRRSNMILPIDGAIQSSVKNILQNYPRLLDTRKNRSGADPFVIGLAQLQNATVLTQEPPTNSLAKPNIPDVCAAMNIRCINLLQLIKEQGWVF